MPPTPPPGAIGRTLPRLAFALLAAVLLAAIALGVLLRGWAAAEREAARLAVIAATAERLAGLTYGVVMGSRGLYFAEAPAARQAFAAEKREYLARFLAEFDRLSRLAPADPEMPELRRAAERFAAQRAAMIEAALADGPAAARALGDHAANRAERRALNALLDDWTARYGAAAGAASAAQALPAHGLLWLVPLWLLVLLLAAAWRLFDRRLLTPLAALGESMGSLARGEGGAVDPALFARQDEVGALARAVASFAAMDAENARLRGELAARVDLLHEAMDAAPSLITVYAESGALLYANREARRRFPPDLAPEAMTYAGLVRARLAARLGGAALEAALAERLAAFAQGHAPELDITRADGSIWRVAMRALPGGERVFVGIDVTEPRRQAEALARAEAHTRTVLAMAPVGLWELDRAGGTLFANQRLAALFDGAPPARFGLAGLAPSEPGEGPFGFVPGVEAELTLRPGSGPARQLIVAASGWAARGDGSESCVLGLQDVTALRAAQAELAHLALHDALTGLPNRKGLHMALGSALAMARRGGGMVAVHAFDLDHFKEVNDALGHAAGDALLREVAARLRAAVRKEDTVARLGGDEFVVVQVGLRGAPDAVVLAERMAARLGEPYELDGHQVVAGASIGLAVAPQDAEEAEALLRRADTALYRAKAARRGGVVCFAPGMDAALEHRRAFEQELRAALGRGEFRLEYQPLFALPGRELVGQEALLRWDHATRGTLLPAEFVPLAETMGLMGAIGAWVLRAACAEAAGWAGGMGVAVNLSPAQLRQGDVVEVVRAALSASGLAPHRLELEITEGTLLGDSETVIAALRGLKALGVRIAMDDFGTGYSALAYLWRFPFDKLKIDGSFVRRLPSDPKVAAVVGTIVSLGRTLNLRVTAEGVETEEQLRALTVAGCDEGQGFWLGRPGPVLEAAGEAAA